MTTTEDLNTKNTLVGCRHRHGDSALERPCGARPARLNNFLEADAATTTNGLLLLLRLLRAVLISSSRLFTITTTTTSAPASMSASSKYAPASYAAAAGADARSSAPSSGASRWAAAANPETPQGLPPNAHDSSPVGFPPLSGVKIVSEAEANVAGPVDDESWPPNPHLTEQVLYLSHLPPNVTKRDLARQVFHHCLPVKFDLDELAPSGQAFGLVRFNRMSNGAYLCSYAPAASV